jgi:hypothetical protein
MRTQRIRWLGLTALIVILPFLPWAYYIAAGLIRGEHFYGWLPSSYWSRAIRSWHDRKTPNPTRTTAWLHRIQSYLFRDARPSVLKGEDGSIPVLIDLFRDREPDVRLAALSAAASIPGFRDKDGISAVPVLIQVIEQDEDGRVRDKAIVVLTSLGPAVVPLLIQALEHPSASVRKGAAYALGQHGPESQAAIPSLIKALKDRDEEVRRDAEIALFLIDPKKAAAAGVE